MEKFKIKLNKFISFITRQNEIDELKLAYAKQQSTMQKKINELYKENAKLKKLQLNHKRLEK